MKKHQVVSIILLAIFLSAGLTAQQSGDDPKAVLAAEQAKMEEAARNVQVAVGFIEMAVSDLKTKVAKTKAAKDTNKESSAKADMRKSVLKVLGIVQGSYYPATKKFEDARDEAYAAFDKIMPTGDDREALEKTLEVVRARNQLAIRILELVKDFRLSERMLETVKEAGELMKK